MKFDQVPGKITNSLLLAVLGLSLHGCLGEGSQSSSPEPEAFDSYSLYSVHKEQVLHFGSRT